MHADAKTKPGTNNPVWKKLDEKLQIRDCRIRTLETKQKQQKMRNKTKRKA